MQIKNTEQTWGWLARALHWLIAAGIVAVIVLGLVQDEMPRGAEKSAVRAVHMAIGLLLFAAMLLRLAWRWFNKTPVHPDSSSAWQRYIAAFVHFGLYALVFLQLAAGMISVAAAGRSIPFFFGIKLPLPIPESDAVRKLWGDVHEAAWKPLLALIVVHVAAALYHHFILKNDVLRRMTTGSN